MSEEGRYIKGGDGSHWVGCEETHWDCKIARLEKENERLKDGIYKAEKFLRVYGKAYGFMVELLTWLKEYGKEKE